MVEKEEKKIKTHCTNRKRSIPAFLIKAYEIVQDEKSNSIISWTEKGDSFQVKDPSLFTNKILPYHFKHQNFSSFIRQLNMYGFNKSRCDAPNEFMHKYFQRDMKELLIYIKRKPNDNHKKIKETSIRANFHESDHMLEKRNYQTHSNDKFSLGEFKRLKTSHHSLEKGMESIVDQNKLLVQNYRSLKSEYLNMKNETEKKIRSAISLSQGILKILNLESNIEIKENSKDENLFDTLNGFLSNISISLEKSENNPSPTMSTQSASFNSLKRQNASHNLFSRSSKFQSFDLEGEDISQPNASKRVWDILSNSE